MNELQDIKGIFRPPKKSYYIGKLQYGTPYFWPCNFSNTVLKIRKIEIDQKELVNYLNGLKLLTQFLKIYLW